MFIDNLRPYQRDAHDAVISFIRDCLDPVLIECPTASGKSWIAAAIANTINEMSGKKVLVLAPSEELVVQNREKYMATGNPASLYCASAGQKDLKHNVIFGSPLTVSNTLAKFGSNIAAIVMDEAHGITPTVIRIIEHIKKQNPLVRVIGMTATPYRLGTGYIYKHHYQHGQVEETVDPYFHTLAYAIPAKLLLDEGYLTRPVFEATGEHYDTSSLSMNRMGQWVGEDKAFEGKGRKTAAIVADVIEKSRNRRGVMLFAATVKHAHEIMASLPSHLSAMVTGETNKKERREIISCFKDKKIKYLVSIGALTTGFDATHVDVVALLRKTESPGLLQQIIGRGLRLDPLKSDCLILDYAENLDYHFPNGDVFAPDIRARRSGGSEGIQCVCPDCGGTNNFPARPNPDGFNIDAEGYFTDLAGFRIKTGNDQDFPAHLGRRCRNEILMRGYHERCSYQWTSKECPECGHHNDIAARYCSECKFELVDPNEKLKEIAAKMASDPYATRTSAVNSMQLRRHPGKDGKPDTLRVDVFIDEKPGEVSTWYSPNATSHFLMSKWARFSRDTWGEILTLDQALERRTLARSPTQLAFRKKEGTKFFEVVSFDYTVRVDGTSDVPQLV